MALPVVAPFGALYRWSGPVRKLAGIAQAVVVALVTATVAGGLLTRSVGALLATDWPLWLIGLIGGGAAFAALRTLKPIGTMAGLIGLGGLTARVPKVALGAAATWWATRSRSREGVAEGLAGDTRVRAEDRAAAPPAVHALPAPSISPPAHADLRSPAAAPAAVAAAPAPQPSAAVQAADRPRPLALPRPPGDPPADVRHPPPRAPEPDVWDAHLVIGRDGREVYEVYQRKELVHQ
jgi:hypothetical protein